MHLHRRALPPSLDGASIEPGTSSVTIPARRRIVQRFRRTRRRGDVGPDRESDRVNIGYISGTPTRSAQMPDDVIPLTYRRVSTYHQERDGVSLDVQTRQCLEYVRRQAGWRLGR